MWRAEGYFKFRGLCKHKSFHLKKIRVVTYLWFLAIQLISNQGTDTGSDSGIKDIMYGIQGEDKLSPPPLPPNTEWRGGGKLNTRPINIGFRMHTRKRHIRFLSIEKKLVNCQKTHLSFSKTHLIKKTLTLSSTISRYWLFILYVR